ncbi:cortical cell-delineating protein-like [Lolium perenne]|jgi:hypothetical protein|uniref:cortical cell-delineating protein-like n=1 Tax=Lolium perenne TaxID=4522 RepID=UPI0021F54010|nr:cortical cell-delineating protein-like [Lolium perenne]
MAPSSKKLVVLSLALSLMIAAVHGCGPHCRTPSPPPPATSGGTCPINTLTLGVCGNVLNLLKLHLGVPADEQCCPLLHGLADLDAAVCLCTAIRANILGVINLNVTADIVLLLNQCGKTCPPGFTCPR